MKLSTLIKGCNAEILSGSPDTEVKAVCCDSRKATEGALFAEISTPQAR